MIGGDSGIVECLGEEFFKHPHLTYTIKARKKKISNKNLLHNLKNCKNTPTYLLAIVVILV